MITATEKWGMKSSGKLVNVLPKPAVVTVLGGLAEKRHYPAQLIATEGRQMKLQAEAAVATGSAVKVDVDGGLVLGTATGTEAGAGGGAVITIEIDQVIPDTAGLARLVSAVLGQKPPATVSYIPQQQTELETAATEPVLRPSARQATSRQN